MRGFLLLIGHIRTFVNNRLFGRVNNGLSSTEMVYLDQLLLGDIEESIATLNLLKSPGGPDLLLQKYEEIAAYNTNNHLPLMWRFYSPHRKILFDLVRSLDILSTSADESVIDALSFILDNEHKRGRHLPFEIDLSFVGKQWRALVIQQVNGTQVLVRQQLEICIFSYLADDFKAGDACVVGSLSCCLLPQSQLHSGARTTEAKFASDDVRQFNLHTLLGSWF